LRALHIAHGPLHKLADDVLEGIAPFEWMSSETDIPRSHICKILGPRWIEDLPSIEYLQSWFPEPVLAQAVAALRVVRKVAADPQDQKLLEIVLSDQLRECSFQDPDDLRIRRRAEPQANYPLLTHFSKAVRQRFDRVARARSALGSIGGRQTAMLHDVVSRTPVIPHDYAVGKFDAIITSPPYAAALPYIDTQRLSLVMLGLITSADIRATETQLIGARELTKRQRLNAEASIRAGDSTLPHDAIAVCRALLDAAARPGNGFRRQNQPALVYRYLRQMSDFFANVKPLLQPRAAAAFVVGVNKTTLGGERFVIDTPELIVAVARHRGYDLEEIRPMDTYARYDLHQQNSIDAERLVVLRAPTG
jgi:hypothetical protein